jgi:hypothetical protein
VKLKTVTTALVIIGLILLVLWPFVIGPMPPAAAAPREKAEYLAKSLGYVTGLMVTWVAVATCALILMRQIRNEMKTATDRNLRELVEGTLRDHDKRRKDDPQA